MQQPTRRAVLRTAVLASVVVAVPVLGSAHGLAATAPATRLRRRQFAPHLRSRFLLEAGGRSYRARLVAIGDHDRAAGDDRRFTLLFDTAGATPPEGVFAVRHPVLRPIELFLAPVGATPGRYEAVVSA